MAAKKKSRDTHELVQKAYGAIARERSSCCGPAKSCCGTGESSAPVAVTIGGEANPVPESELGLSCGNPVAFSLLREGETVLDLGSGAGKDVFLAAQRVGPAGRAIGVDMTPDMLTLARRHAEEFTRRTGLANVEFREGLIEHLPLPDASVDVIISNCVINLSPDKPQVFREAFRVLKPSGRIIVSDIVLNRPLPAEARDDEDLHVACIAGALLREEYLQAIRQAGFASVEVLSDRTYHAKGDDGDPSTSKAANLLDGISASVTVLATKE